MTRKIGYGSPPEHSRWAKGQSGNPSGRPKKAAALGDDLKAELAEMMQITEGGKVRKITKQRALIKSLTAGGIKGNTRAASLMIALCARLIKDDPAAAADLTATDRKIVEDYLERQVQVRLAERVEGAK